MLAVNKFVMLSIFLSIYSAIAILQCRRRAYTNWQIRRCVLVVNANTLFFYCVHILSYMCVHGSISIHNFYFVLSVKIVWPVISVGINGLSLKRVRGGRQSTDPYILPQHLSIPDTRKYLNNFWLLLSCQFLYVYFFVVVCVCVQYGILFWQVS